MDCLFQILQAEQDASVRLSSALPLRCPCAAPVSLLREHRAAC